MDATMDATNEGRKERTVIIVGSLDTNESVNSRNLVKMKNILIRTIIYEIQIAVRMIKILELNLFENVSDCSRELL